MRQLISTTVLVSTVLMCLTSQAMAQSSQPASVPPNTAAAVAPPNRLPTFKGDWPGPSKILLPGPGPTPGQSLADYFATLPSGDRRPVRLHVLALGGSRGFHHDSISAAMNVIYDAGKRTGLWDTEFATDYGLVNARGGKPMKSGFQPVGLYDFEAVVVAGASGDWGLTDAQKEALLAYVRTAGRGLVVIHAGIDANHSWKDYIDMIGGEMTGHPFNTPEKVLVSFPIVNESPQFPAVRHLPQAFRKQDELYVLRNWSRTDINVLLRLDASKLDYSVHSEINTQLPPDHDFPVAWTKRYGKGRVFASTLGHPAEAFEDPDIVQMYSEAVKWSLGLTEGDERAHSLHN